MPVKPNQKSRNRLGSNPVPIRPTHPAPKPPVVASKPTRSPSCRVQMTSAPTPPLQKAKTLMETPVFTTDGPTKKVCTCSVYSCDHISIYSMCCHVHNTDNTQYTHTRTHTHTLTHASSHMHTHMHTHTPSHMHTRAHTRTRTHASSHMHTHSTHTHPHTCTHTAHTRTRTHTHTCTTHTHTHTSPPRVTFLQLLPLSNLQYVHPLATSLLSPWNTSKI